MQETERLALLIYDMFKGLSTEENEIRYVDSIKPIADSTGYEVTLTIRTGRKFKIRINETFN